MDNNKIDTGNLDYTIVLDKNYIGPDSDKMNVEPQKSDTGSDDSKAAIDSLYSEYEKMCLKDPTVIDTDDAYPHAYQWRIVDRYDPAKVNVIKEALKQGKRVADTEAYASYVDAVSSMRFKPESWD